MKTIANCNTKEFFQQAYKLSERIKNYADGIKKIKEAKDLEDKTPFGVISYICGDNIDETMELCGALCFMSGEEFANLDGSNDEDGISAMAEIFSSKRCTSFFITALRLKNIYEML